MDAQQEFLLPFLNTGATQVSWAPCSPKTGPPDMLESPEIEEEEDSDERQSVQSREDHRYFEGGGLQDGHHR